MLLALTPLLLKKKKKKRSGEQETLVFIVSFSRTSRRTVGPPARLRHSDIFMRLGVVLRPTSSHARVSLMNPRNGRDAVCRNLLRRSRPSVFTFGHVSPTSAFFTRYISAPCCRNEGCPGPYSRLCSNFDVQLLFSELMVSTILMCCIISCLFFQEHIVISRRESFIALSEEFDCSILIR